MAYQSNDEFPATQLLDTPKWSENFACYFTDPKSGVAIMYSAGRWHSDLNLWREFIFVGLPGGRVLFQRGYGRTPNERGPGGCFSRYEIVDPLKSVRLTYDGPIFESTTTELFEHGPGNDPPAKRLVFDMRFDGAAPLWDMKGDSAEASTMIGAMHIDHAGRANGTLQYGDEKFTVSDGYAIRDHSRGVRDMRHYGAHAWINGSFPDGRAFYLYAMRAQGSSEIGMSNAAVAQGAKLYPATLRHIDMLQDPRDCARPHRMVLDSELGTMEIEAVATLNSFPFSMVQPFDTMVGLADHRPTATIYDEFVRIRWNGQESYGWSERGVALKPL